MMRNRALWIFIGILVIWNVILSVILYQRDNVTVENGVQTTVIQNEVNGFSTDLTAIYDDVRSSIVTIETENTLGSGIIYRQVDDTVYIVTNYHLIEMADSYHASLDNYQRIELSLVGFDPILDVAVLIFESQYTIDPIAFGDSRLLEAGEFVVAVGSPLSSEYRASLTFGIVSSPMRTLDLNIDDRSYFIDMIQSDVDLNAGNSGGPIINMAGELVGLNTLSVSISDSDGLSFSLPSHELRLVVDEIIESGSVTKNDLGIKVTPITELTNYQKAALNIDLSLDHGLLVEEVKNGFLGESLGLRSGDIILAIRDQDMVRIEDMIDQEYAQGSTINVVIRQGNEEATLESVIE